MSARYIAIEQRGEIRTPRCDLPGSPFASKLKAKQAAARERIERPAITNVRRSA